MGRLLRPLGFAVSAVALLVPAAARAGALDVDLLHLCAPHTPDRGPGGSLAPECSWIQRQANGSLAVALDADAESRFRSLMSELGVALAPRLLVPADTLGSAGFQISAEVGAVSINSDQAYWNGVSGVSPDSPAVHRPGGWANTIGIYLRKGLWFPVPSVELGGGVVHLLDSRMLSWQGYAKLALHEGFAELPLPSLAVRASVSGVTGADQIRMAIAGVDVILSRGFGVGKTFRFEPFGGASFLFIRARSSPFDLTPSCDAYFARTATPGTALGDYCAPAQRGTNLDLAANFAFPDQDTITRRRFFIGAKVKFAAVFASFQYEIVPAGRSLDQSKPAGARDLSGKQEGLALSTGFDF
jgi:hypothetical protein